MERLGAVCGESISDVIVPYRTIFDMPNSLACSAQSRELLGHPNHLQLAYSSLAMAFRWIGDILVWSGMNL
jgi:hypothetical protein